MASTCAPRGGSPRSLILAIAIIASIWILFSARDTLGAISSHIPSVPSYSSSSSTSPSSSSSSGNIFPIPPNNTDITNFCARHRLRPFSPRHDNHDNSPNGPPSARKIYDLLLINIELEMLELRLSQMYPHVDYFIILESAVTFTNQPKPLHVLDNWARFAPFHDKMIRHSLDTDALGFTADTDAWTREHQSRNALFSQIIPFLDGARAARDGDVLLVSDVDEIPKPATLAALRTCDFPAHTSLASNTYYYSFQWLGDEDWPRPHATLYRGPKDTVLPQDLRDSHNGQFRMENAAWHCSFCFDELRAMANKVESFSHQEFNLPEFKDPKAILERVRLGKDFFDRADRNYHYIEANHDVPEVLKLNAQKYRYLLDRTPFDANFVDYADFFGPKEEENAPETGTGN